MQEMLMKALEDINDNFKAIGVTHRMEDKELEKYFGIYMAKTKTGKVGLPKDLPRKFLFVFNSFLAIAFDLKMPVK